MAAKLPGPVNGKCLPTTWFNMTDSGNTPVSIPCPGLLAIWTSDPSQNTGVAAYDGSAWHGRCLTTDINLSGYYGFSTGLCSGTPFFPRVSALFIDVWAMYRAGLWSSSIAFPVSHWCTRTPVTTKAVIVGIADTTVNRCNISSEISSTGKAWATSCAVFNSAFTVTVFDNGTFTVT